MADVAPGGGGAVARAGEAVPGAAAGTGSTISDFLYRAMMMFAFYNLFFKGSAPATPSDPAMIGRNLFKPNQPIELFVYMSEQSKFVPLHNDETTLLWHVPDLVYGSSLPDAKYSANFTTTIHPSERVQSNGTLFAHACIAKAGSPLDEFDPAYDATAVVCKSKLITRFRPRLHQQFKKLLVSDMDDAEEERQRAAALAEKLSPVYISYWSNQLVIDLVEDQSAFNRNSVPPQIKDYLTFEETTGNYFPILDFNDFWMMRDDLYPINETTTELPLEISFSLQSLWKWTLLIQMEQSFEMQHSWGQMGENDADNFKRMITDTNPYLLGLTMVVSLLHSVFDFLAFKNDVVFWKKRDSMAGLSVRTIFMNIGFQFIIFLYLLDNDTSWLILISSGVGLAIEVWKVSKAVNLVPSEDKIFSIIPRLTYTHKKSYQNSKTKEYDDLAFRYLSWLLLPLVACYSIYSLVYETHKSWYSWVIASLVGAVYTFGFIMMTPQLFINYKLQSVAHLPWRMLTYKALNTFIDDLFAFIIKMPTMHRLACFRDDIIFFIFLYQRWKYPVDAERRNEFQGGDDDDDAEPSNETTPTTAAAAAAIESTPATESAAQHEGSDPIDTAAPSDATSSSPAPSTSTTDAGELRQRKGRKSTKAE
ncbi:transmembrane CLPTM1 family protein [Capsaspora owczarzaki ATCC 30864]|uniref:transmembrane CLPTM1 family protein n=1 Tax=Capsaspora owczarzaki (strain ATCC 30864) TaxID=595528 RepID=UPI00035267A6|nr:transmembrane CLPTM1 family protein [Capsaspora owczarzaki ATCC 30864]|eukprot:XP_004349086.2 transmembrane CLPTM1 family protein [Capsaspora owczarzaki ATCC 30864]